MHYDGARTEFTQGAPHLSVLHAQSLSVSVRKAARGGGGRWGMRRSFFSHLIIFCYLLCLRARTYFSSGVGFAATLSEPAMLEARDHAGVDGGAGDVVPRLALAAPGGDRLAPPSVSPSTTREPARTRTPSNGGFLTRARPPPFSNAAACLRRCARQPAGPLSPFGVHAGAQAESN